ncbi:Dyp-type peroxidase [Sphingomonas sp. HF-S4]|uniref:Dyp-type peroxidase n=1 Tax=Sphingomonas agrestis TaxID=3080540 RepID=A0ABU3Y982_9SPHN|nr:Dyp-type peroxidase domain-containing protein [Sphingomonas sp. HF-S4]MDV3457924.1 Dyp-type peroxidase [Sphingomonas sp. HF-S4]
MATKQPVRSLSIGPTSDLVVAAPWRPGLIQADESMTPGARLARTFQAIFAIRQRAREALTEPAFADPIERLEQIHSFRLSAEEDEMRLSVTFDFGWESYMRALWKEAGPFLDLLCCHCADYKLARDTPLHEWQQWIRDNQRASHYFYSATPLTVCDLAGLSQAERAGREQVDAAAADRLLTGFCSRSATELSREVRLRAPAAAVDQAIRVILAMYRLTRYWTTDVTQAGLGEDAKTLIRATRGMIEGHFVDPGSFPPPLEAAYAAELSWYRQRVDAVPPEHTADAHDPANIQRGVAEGFDQETITHGAAIFLAVAEPVAARAALATLIPTGQTAMPEHGIFRNVAFTFRGLERLEIPAGSLAQAPAAFREGAAARAAAAGDLREFHPSKWRSLRRNWGSDPEARVALDQVDLFVQLRVSSNGPADIHDPGHPLAAEIGRLAGLAGLELLAVEALAPAVPGGGVDHLGFEDGLSQPLLDGPETKPWSDAVAPGALLVGRGEVTLDEFWRDGSFLAVRRMPIDRARFDALIAGDTCPALHDPDLLAAKLMGRRADGQPLAANYGANNFVYDGDECGAVCPLDSHVRRANPRRGNVPRIMRRGMSFGPPRDSAESGERGAFFMAYCADLAEQYERVLGWVNGGNSTRVGSYLADPLAGAPTGAGGRTYRFLHGGTVHRVQLPDPQRGVIGLSWSLYLFAPSLGAIQGIATPIVAQRQSPASDERTAAGRKLLARLQGASAEVWERVISEADARAPLFAAIQADRGGILQTPLGYFVASHARILEILRDDGARFSNAGAGARMRETIGLFHLGMDPSGPDYHGEAGTANKALASVTSEMAFDAAREATKQILGKIFQLRSAPVVAVDLIKDLIEPLLGMLAKSWFDVPDGTQVELGPQDWRMPPARKPRFPGDFWNPSRYAFNPFPTPETERLAVIQGKASVAAVAEHIGTVGRGSLTGSVSSRIAADKTAYPTDADLARVLVGSMIGAVPTVAGNALRIVSDMLKDGSFDPVQRQWRTTSDQGHASALALLRPATDKIFLKTPIPELLWRTAAADGVMLGEIPLRKGDRIVFSLEAASRERNANGAVDRDIPFGRASEGRSTAHGCPAHAMADGIILGLVAGMAESGNFTSQPAAMAELRPFP